MPVQVPGIEHEWRIAQSRGAEDEHLATADVR